MTAKSIITVEATPVGIDKSMALFLMIRGFRRSHWAIYSFAACFTMFCSA